MTTQKEYLCKSIEKNQKQFFGEDYENNATIKKRRKNETRRKRRFSKKDRRREEETVMGRINEESKSMQEKIMKTYL